MLKNWIKDDPIHRFASIFSAVLIIVLLPNSIVEKLFYEHYQHLQESPVNFQQKRKLALLLNDKLKKNQYFLSFDEHINAMLPLSAVVPNKDLVPFQSKFNYQLFTQQFNSGQIRFIVCPSQRKSEAFMGCNFSEFNAIFHDKDFTILETKNWITRRDK